MTLQTLLLFLVGATVYCNTGPAEVFCCVAYNDSCMAYKALPLCFEPRLPEGQTWHLTTEAFRCVAYNDSSKHVAYKGLPACFGPSLLAKGLTRCSMRVIPPDDCHAENPLAPRNTSRMGTALIQEYDCFFVEKVRAQQAGYQVAVGHDVDSEQLTAMMAGDKEVQQLIKALLLFNEQLVSLPLQETLQGKKGEYTRLSPLQQHLNSDQDSGESCLQDLSTQDFIEMFVITLAVILVMVKVIQCKKTHKIAPRKARKIAPRKARKNPLKLKPYAFKPDKYKTRAVRLTEDTDNDCLRILFCSYSYKGASVKMWYYTWSLNRSALSCEKVEMDSNGGGDFLSEHAGENDVEEEQNHEVNAFRRGHGDGAYDDEAEQEEAALWYWRPALFEL